MSQPPPTPSPLPAHHWTVATYGDLKNLRLSPTTVPSPLSHELRLHVRAIGLNFADVFAILGLYDPAGDPPFTPGFEASGIVESAGSAVTNFQPGDNVLCFIRFGCYATVINVPATLARPFHPAWSFADAAAFPAQAFTAWYALCVLAGFGGGDMVGERKVVLVHSAAGGVGLQLVEMVHRLGGIVVCTVGRVEKVAVLEERGVPRERIVVRGVDDRDGFEQVVRERALAGVGGVDVVVDSVLGEYFQPGMALLNVGGRYVVMGAASFMVRGSVSPWAVGGVGNLVRLGWRFLRRPRLDVVRLINENKGVVGFNASELFGQERLIRTAFEEIGRMQLPKPMVGRTFAFDEAVQALRFFQSGESVGKIVLLVGEDD